MHVVIHIVVQKDLDILTNNFVSRDLVVVIM